MTLETIRLVQLIEDWITAHPILKDHFLVERRKMSSYGGFADDRNSRADAYVSYTCPNRSNLWAIVFIGDGYVEDIFTKTKFVAEDPEFFTKLEVELYRQHDINWECKEYLSERTKKNKRR